jgi:hypothetical protein
MLSKMLNRTAYKIIGAILLLGTSYFVYQIVPYIIANYQYEQLVVKEGLSRQKVEDILFLYSSREIPIKDSLWGKNVALENGDICWQYLILWKEPIDIVYNKDQVSHVFASYE